MACIDSGQRASVAGSPLRDGATPPESSCSLRTTQPDSLATSRCRPSPSPLLPNQTLERKWGKKKQRQGNPAVSSREKNRMQTRGIQDLKNATVSKQTAEKHVKWSLLQGANMSLRLHAPPTTCRCISVLSSRSRSSEGPCMPVVYVKVPTPQGRSRRLCPFSIS